MNTLTKETNPIKAPLLRCQDISKTFQMGQKHVEVLQNVEFQVCSGEIVVLYGKSGQGKSVLLSLLSGLDRPSKGDIYFDGVWFSSCTQKQLADIRRKQIGIIFQNLNIIPSWTAIENVAAALEDIVPASKFRYTRALHLLKEMGMEHRLDHMPKNLSMGEQQRVAIARTLIREPKFILADEPTGDLDATTANHIMDLLRSYLQKTNSTMLVATHGIFSDMNCHRILNIHEGVISQHVHQKTLLNWKPV